MYPVLLQIGDFKVDSYNVLWLTALSLAILWCVRRFRLYGVNEGEGRRVVCWAFLVMLLGAGLYKPLSNIRRFAAAPVLILTEGGLSEMGAILGAFLSAFLLCWKNPKAPFQRLCDVAALPAILAIVVGRWGCFLNGCCVGVISDFPLALHFPRDPVGVLRHPTQLYYSICAAVILVALLVAERALLRRDLGDVDRPHHAVLAPLALILYSVMRLSVDVLRAPAEPTQDFQMGHYILLTLLPFECIWLTLSLRKITGHAAF